MPVIKKASPLNTKLVAIVERKDWTLYDVIIIPFKYPKIIPIIGAINKPIYGLKLIAIHAEVTLDTAKIAPVDKSKPPTIITSVSAHAIMAKGAFWFNIFSKFLGVRKASLERVNIIINIRIKIKTA